MNTHGLNDRDSPILFQQISDAYAEAFDVIWNAEFKDKNRFHWNKNLIFHPISQTLGVALETSIKGLLICRTGKAKKTHDLEKLFRNLNDAELEKEIAESLSKITAPEAYFLLNSEKSKQEVSDFYRSAEIQIQLLNRVYDRPFASRYPVLGGHSLPDPEAVRVICAVICNVLRDECRNWVRNT